MWDLLAASGSCYDDCQSSVLLFENQLHGKQTCCLLSCVCCIHAPGESQILNIALHAAELKRQHHSCGCCRSCQSPTYGRTEPAPFSSPPETAGPSYCDSSDVFGHAWRPTLSHTLPAHRPPWSSASLQQSSTPNQGIPCVVLQAAGYAPRFPQQDGR